MCLHDTIKNRRILRTGCLTLSLISMLYGIWQFMVVYQNYASLADQDIDTVRTRAELAAASAGLITSDYCNLRIATLIAEEDISTAKSYLAVAEQQGLSINPEILAQYEQTQSLSARLFRQTKRAGAGFLTGKGDSLAHIGGSVTSDFFLYGDVRDFGKESYHYLNDQEVDEFLFTLSGIGLALTVGTYATAGSTAPLKYGVSVTKLAKRTGHLSSQFSAFLRTTLRRSLPSNALKTNLKAVPRTDYLKHLQLRRLKDEYSQAVAKSINHQSMVKLEKVFDDLYIVGQTAGTTATLRLLKHVDTPADLAKIRTVAQIGGKKTLAWNDAFGSRLLKLVKTSTKLTVKMIINGLLALITLAFSLFTGVLAFAFERFATHRFLQFLIRNKSP